MKNNIRLDELVRNGVIKDYELEIVSDEGIIGTASPKGRNTDRLTITFNDGHLLTLDTFCSGCLEDTCLIVS